MKLYGLIGYPLGHSFSKKYFTEKFRTENIQDCSYELFPLSTITEFPLLLKKQPLLKGLNVTIPYKQEVLKYVTVQTEEVQKIGAANTLKINEEVSTAYNTDVIGFEKSFLKKLQPAHKKALVLGTGGSSKAVQYVLQKLRLNYLLVSRNNESSGTIDYSKVDGLLLKEYTVIINCTPLGMSPNVQNYPQLPYHLLTPRHYLFDLIYTPEKTLFLQKGEERGAIIQNGFDMLLIQAEESWKIWNGD